MSIGPDGSNVVICSKAEALSDFIASNLAEDDARIVIRSKTIGLGANVVIGGQIIPATALLGDASLIQVGKTMPIGVLLASSMDLDDASVAVGSKKIPLNSFLAGIGTASSISGRLSTASQTELGSCEHARV